MVLEKRQKAQVVVVGAGPTGLAAANLLGLYGIETLVLERNPMLSHLPKAVTIDDEGLRICQAMGLQEEILKHIQGDLKVEYYSGKRLLARITPLHQPNGYPLISTFQQPILEAILLSGLERFTCVQVQFGQILEGFTHNTEMVTLKVSMLDGTQQEITCSYLLACDGGKSMIRQALSIPLLPVSAFPFFFKKSSDTTQRWLVADLEDKDGTEREKIIFFCNPTRPAVTVPTPGKTRRWEFMLFPNEREEMMLKPERLQALIGQTYFKKGASLQTGTVIRQAIYTFHALIAASFSQGRIFLLGDAAHMMPPFGGQGLNSGLRDAHNLCWKLAYVLRGKAPIDLLRSYEQERALHTTRMIRFSERLGHIIMPTGRAMAAVRDLFFRGINHVPLIRQGLNEMRVKPVASYREGLSGFWGVLMGGRRRLIGTLLPQVWVKTEEGKEVLLDELLGNGFALLRLNEKQGIREVRGEVRLVETILSGERMGRSRKIEELKRVKACTLPANREGLSRVAHRSNKSWLLLRPDHFVMDILSEDDMFMRASADKDLAGADSLSDRLHNGQD